MYIIYTPPPTPTCNSKLLFPIGKKGAEGSRERSTGGATMELERGGEGKALRCSWPDWFITKLGETA